LPISRRHWQRPHEVIAGRARGLSPLEAALTGSRDIGFTIVSITLSRIAAPFSIDHLATYSTLNRALRD